jgi:hypothetical protein
MRRWLGTVIGVRGRLEITIWIATAIAVTVLLLVSLLGGVGTRIHGVVLAVPWFLILILAAVRAYRRGHGGRAHDG